MRRGSMRRIEVSLTEYAPWGVTCQWDFSATKRNHKPVTFTTLQDMADDAERRMREATAPTGLRGRPDTYISRDTQ